METNKINKIKILPEEIFNKIAAGEVVERPASVVKELVENSIDAGASSIKISVDEGGIKNICVIDNGCGMSPDDALLCLAAHATSKIKDERDLNSINTLGFRGEALPSIASVSRFKLRTKMKELQEGTELYCEGGKILECHPTGCANGTEVIVKDLFFNVPARRKFLGSPDTEEKYLYETLINIAIANFAIDFVYILNGKELINSRGEEEPSIRIIEFFGKDFFQSLIPVDHEEEGIKISGYIAKHGFFRASKREQRLIINGRPAEAAIIHTAIKDAYGSLIPQGKYAPVILFIQTNPIRVDVNVHPAKREVRFREPLLFKRAVEKAIRETLRNSHSTTIHLNSEIPLRQLLDAAQVSYLPEENKKFTTPNLTNLSLTNETPKSDSTENNLQNLTSAKKNSIPPLEIIGVLDNTYLIAKSPDGLVIIDQHAAHERILYEALLKSAENETIRMQKLLIPITVELSSDETEFITKNSLEFEKLGFEIEKFGRNTIIVQSIPSPLPQENILNILKEIIDALLHDSAKEKTDYAKIARAACKSAVKSHDKLKSLEISALLKLLSECEMPFCCPHGRPTMINISRSEIQKRFGRGPDKKQN